MKGLFITGTDTGVGKTVVTGLLGRFFLDKGCNVITQKWIETGSSGLSSDISLHLSLMNMPKKNIKDYLPYVSSYVFRFASSPHLAARLEKKNIKPDKIKDSFKALSKNFDFVIVEGAGGALVPFNKRKLIIDIAQELGLPVLIVAGNKLGAINHTLLTVEALRKRKMKIIGIVFNNQSTGINRTVLENNPQIVKTLTNETVFGMLPRLKNREHLYRTFIPIARKIFTRLKEGR